MKPELKGTAADIRLSWSLSYSSESFIAALDDRGMTLARISESEAHSSTTAHAFAKEIGRYAPNYTQGEIVVVNQFGDVHRINERTTGNTRSEIEKHLGSIDGNALPTMTEVSEPRRERIDALQQLRNAARADNAMLAAMEDETFRRERRERKADAEAAAHDKWLTRAEADRARIDPIGPAEVVTKPVLAVADAAGSIVDSLVGFIAGLGGGSPKREFSSAGSAQQLVAQRKALEAVENIRKSMERGEPLMASDIQNLAPSQIEIIKQRGDDAMRLLIEDMQRDRLNEYVYGRGRER